MDKKIELSTIEHIFSKGSLLPFWHAFREENLSSHGWIFESSPWCGGPLLVELCGLFAKEYLGHIFAHQDCITIKAINQKTISIQDIKEILHRLANTPQQQSYLVLIPNSEELTLEASNTLLKYLEEPPAPTIFLMGTWSTTLPLKTIRSRASVITQNITKEELPKKETELFLDTTTKEVQNFLISKPELLFRLSHHSEKNIKEWVSLTDTLLNISEKTLKNPWTLFDMRKTFLPLMEEEVPFDPILPGPRETFFLTFEHTLGTILRADPNNKNKALLQPLLELRSDLLSYRNKKISLLKFFQAIHPFAKHQ